MPLINAHANNIANWYLGTSMPAFPTNIYLAAFTADPGVGGALTDEVTETGYARILLDRTSILGTAVNGVFSNANGSVTFHNPGAQYASPVLWVAVMDALTAGAMLWSGQITSTTPDTGSPLTFAVGALTFDVAQ